MLMTRRLNLEGMSIDEMWQLHEEISQVLSVRLTTEKRELEKRLSQLRRINELHPSSPQNSRSLDEAPRDRRKYPQVLPKYRNPKVPSETWSGRGKQPRWLTAALNTGHAIDEFVIRQAESKKSKNKNEGVRQRSQAARV
jgi:DNA-binding protein H-NS